jgi:hypothetical protein
MKMMKKIASVMVLLALCIPALAVDMPNMVGNWTGGLHGVDWMKNTNFQTTGKAFYWDATYTITIDEQNGTRFSGKMILDDNPLKSEVVLGIIGSDNMTIALVDENDYYWGSMKSPTEMELFGPSISMEHTDIATGTFTKE